MDEETKQEMLAKVDKALTDVREIRAELQRINDALELLACLPSIRDYLYRIEMRSNGFNPDN